MRFAITGNRGLIGQSLKDRLVNDGNECVMQVDRREGFDIMDLMFKDYEVPKIDLFIHSAAQCKISEAIARPILPHKNNVDGIFSVLEFCKDNQVPRVMVMSSSRVLSPERNPYTASKVYVEELTKAYSQCYGLEHIIIRPSTVFGPMFDETSRLINNWLTAAFKDEPLRLYGDRTKTLDFTYISDFVDGCMIAMNGDWNKEYNISGNNSVPLLDIANYIIEQIGSKSTVQFLPPETAQPQHVSVDTSAIDKLGYKPKVSIRDGIKKMISFYEEHPEYINLYKDKGVKYYNGKK